MTEDGKKPKRGLALLTPEERKAFARLGGLAVPAHRRGFAVNREAAKRCGSKGGKAPRDLSTNTFRNDPERARRLASEGGKKTALSRRARKAQRKRKRPEKGSRWVVSE